MKTPRAESLDQGGFEPFPHLYADMQRLHEFAELPIEVLEQRASQYAAFLQNNDLMPRARSQADRLLNHIIFELTYREGEL